MERNIMKDLLRWKEIKDTRMPLLLYGARQVGKTYILREFGNRYYRNTVYVNFERMAAVSDFFSGDLSPTRLLKLLEEYFNQKILPGETLIIFDEIGVCERALTSLKYFCDEAPEYHVVGAGSLLGVNIHRERYSFPVGKVYMKTLYPLSFDEFLMAMDEKHLLSMVIESFDQMSPMPESSHLELLRWYQRFLIIGGMPAVVNEYIRSESMVNVPEIQQLILNAYTADMSKYTGENASTKIRGAYMSMPMQLSKENKKFQYKLIRKGATAGMFGDSINWLVQAGLVYECNRISEGRVPLNASRDLSAFKLYLSDVGLLSVFSGIDPQNIIRNDFSDAFRGALAENYVAQSLVSSGYDLYYWSTDAPYNEVDFVIQKKGEVIPVEVKSGTHVKSKSLLAFQKKYDSGIMYRVSQKNFCKENGLYAIPSYAAFSI